jgi:hypothetical protein
MARSIASGAQKMKRVSTLRAKMKRASPLHGETEARFTLLRRSRISRHDRALTGELSVASRTTER